MKYCSLAWFRRTCCRSRASDSYRGIRCSAWKRRFRYSCSRDRGCRDRSDWWAASVWLRRREERVQRERSNRRDTAVETYWFTVGALVDTQVGRDQYDIEKYAVLAFVNQWDNRVANHFCSTCFNSHANAMLSCSITSPPSFLSSNLYMCF